MLDTIGKRLKCCRAATNTTPQEVVSYVHTKNVQLSYTTYTRWEAGSSEPSRKKDVFLYIADFFGKNGLTVDVNWIITGEGFPPQFAAYTTLDEDTLFILASRTIPNVDLIQIGGVYGEPFLKYGEFCIVSKINDIDINNNKLCYINIDDRITIGIVTIINEFEVKITSVDDIYINKAKLKECRRVKWIQKK